MEVVYTLSGAALAALFFYAGWKFRDSVAVTRGEPPVLVAPRNTSRVLEDWDIPGEDE